MKTHIFILISLILGISNAQKINYDTIFLSKKITTQIIFKKIDYAIPSDESVLGKLETKVLADKQVLIVKPLKEFKGKAIISAIENDNFHEITCIYDEKRAKSFFFFNKETKEIDIQENMTKYSANMEYIKRLNKSPIKKIRAGDGTLIARLEDSYIIDNVIYLKIKINNLSSLDFLIGNIDFKIYKSEIFKNETLPENSTLPIVETEKDIKVIKAESEIIKIFAFTNFSIAKDKSFYMLLTEKSGQRSITLQIPSIYIENATKTRIK